MTACREVLELMSEALDQILSPEKKVLLDKHVAQCPECRAAWKELQWTHAQLKGLETLEPPPWLASKIMARIRAEAQPQASFWRRFIRPIVMKPQLQVASILLLAATGFYLLKSQRSERDVFTEMKQLDAPAPLQSLPAKALEAQDKLIPKSRNEPTGLGKSLQPGTQQNLLEASKPAEAGFAPPPTATPTPIVSPNVEREKQERDRARPEPPAVAPSAPSALAGASVGAGAPAAAESVAVPTRQAKKTLKREEGSVRADSSKEGPRGGMADAKGQLMNAQEQKDKADAAIWVIRLELRDLHSAEAMVERELTRAGATMVSQREPIAPRVLSARIESNRLPELLSRLARLGRILQQPDLPGEHPSLVIIRISW